MVGVAALVGIVGVKGRAKLKRGGTIRDPAKGPLAGVTVIDASVVIAVPSACALLAELGAEVIKLEALDLPDSARGIGPSPAPGMAGLMCSTARGKQSIVLNLKTPEGLAVLQRMVKKADVFCQNFRPGAVERLGIDFASLQKVNPELIYVTSTGFGDAGPYKEKRVYDMLIQSLSGMTSFVDPAEPKLVSHSVHDKATGQAIAHCIIGALYARARGAGGQHLEISMIDAALHWMWPDVYYNYTWAGLPKKEPLNKLLPGPNGPLLDKDEAIKQGEGSKWYVAEHTLFKQFRSPKTPFQFSKTPVEPRPCGPMLGEHTNKILTDLGYSAPEVDELLKKKAATSTASLLLMKNETKKAKVFKFIEKCQSGVTCHGGLKVTSSNKLKAGQPPLTGLRVLDATSMLAGPFTCALLADDGADVIKLETSDLDAGRRLGPSPSGVEMGGFFMAANRSKRSVVAQKDSGVAQRLAASCDIVVLDGTIDLDEAALLSKKPDLVLVKINRGAGDFSTQAACGACAEQVDSNGQRVIPPTLVAEKAAAFYAAACIKSALLCVLQGKGGQQVDVDMEQAGWHTFWIDGMWGHTWLTPTAVPAFPSVSKIFTNLITESRDNRRLFTGVISDKEWQEWLASDLGKAHPPPVETTEKWAGIAGRLGDFDNLVAYVRSIVKKYDAKTFGEMAEAQKLIYALCLTPEETLNNAQVVQNKCVTTFNHPTLGQFRLANAPMKYSNMKSRPFSPAPMPGEHSGEVLLEAGFTKDEVGKLMSSKAVSGK